MAVDGDDGVAGDLGNEDDIVVGDEDNDDDDDDGFVGDVLSSSCCTGKVTTSYLSTTTTLSNPQTHPHRMAQVNYIRESQDVDVEGEYTSIV